MDINEFKQQITEYVEKIKNDVVKTLSETLKSDDINDLIKSKNISAIIYEYLIHNFFDKNIDQLDTKPISEIIPHILLIIKEDTKEYPTEIKIKNKLGHIKKPTLINTNITKTVEKFNKNIVSALKIQSINLKKIEKNLIEVEHPSERLKENKINKNVEIFKPIVQPPKQIIDRNKNDDNVDTSPKPVTILVNRKRSMADMRGRITLLSARTEKFMNAVKNFNKHVRSIGGVLQKGLGFFGIMGPGGLKDSSKFYDMIKTFILKHSVYGRLARQVWNAIKTHYIKPLKEGIGKAIKHIISKIPGGKRLLSFYTKMMERIKNLRTSIIDRFKNLIGIKKPPKAPVKLPTKVLKPGENVIGLLAEAGKGKIPPPKILKIAEKFQIDGIKALNLKESQSLLKHTKKHKDLLKIFKPEQILDLYKKAGWTPPKKILEMVNVAKKAEQVKDVSKMVKPAVEAAKGATKSKSFWHLIFNNPLTRTVAKRAATRAAGGFVPGVSTATGVGLSAWRASEGDWFGSALEAASGLAYDTGAIATVSTGGVGVLLAIPGVAVGVTLDAILITHDFIQEYGYKKYLAPTTSWFVRGFKTEEQYKKKIKDEGNKWLEERERLKKLLKPGFKLDSENKIVPISPLIDASSKLEIEESNLKIKYESQEENQKAKIEITQSDEDRTKEKIEIIPSKETQIENISKLRELYFEIVNESGKTKKLLEEQQEKNKKEYQTLLSQHVDTTTQPIEEVTNNIISRLPLHPTHKDKFEKLQIDLKIAAST